MTPKSHTSAEKPLVCRPSSGLWVVVAIFVAIVLALPISIYYQPPAVRTQNDIGAVIAMGSLFGLPAFWLAIYLLRARITASHESLTLRGFWRTTTIPWPQLEDFELRIASSNQSHPGAAIAYILFKGKWRSLSRMYEPYDRLLERIQQEGQWSRSRTWVQNDLRDDGEWPKVFVYKDVSGWRLVGIYVLFTFTLTGLQFLKAATYGLSALLNNIALIWSGLSLWGRVGLVALPFILFGSVPLLILAQYPAIKTRRRYLGEKLVATHEGLFHQKNGSEVFVTWNEIESYHFEALPGNFQPNLCVVETRRARIEWVTGISDSKTLLALVQSRATDASTPKWIHKNGADEDVLGGAASMWKGGNVGVGPKIHHYRTRTFRILLVFGAFVSLGFFMPLVTGHMNGRARPASNGDLLFSLIAFILINGVVLLGLCGFFFSSLQCEKDGIRQNGVWGERFIAWKDMKSLVSNGYFCTLSGTKNKIRFGMVADAKGLCNEIGKRSGITLKRIDKKTSEPF